MRALELDCDHLIIGGGLAGLVAALRLPGSVILLSNGFGATAVSSGVFHPGGGDREAEEWFLDTMAGSYVKGQCVMVSGASRNGFMPVSTACDGSPDRICINEDRPGFRRIDLFAGRSHQEIARILDTDDEEVHALECALSAVEADSILLPPILGIERAEELRSRISQSLGKSIYEYVTAPSVLGLRLVHALRKKAARREGLMMLDIVEAERLVDGHVEGVMGTKGKRRIRVGAHHLFIATGGPMTGFKVEGDRVFEPLTGATVTRNFEADLDGHFFADHALMHKGIEPELYIHGFDRVRAIGAAACGFGLYKALVSGYHAGDGLE